MPDETLKRTVFPATLYRRLAWLWLGFCIAKMISAMLHEYSEGHLVPWQPLLWEGSSMFVATALVLLQLRWRGLALDLLYARPWRWVYQSLLVLPLFCVLFVAATYGIRHAVYALMGQTYHHAPWGRLFVYESVTLGIFYLLWLGVLFGLATWERLRTEQLQARDMALALRDARLQLLQQQLHPHFLFNALNLISATMYENVPQADRLLHRLANLLRQVTTQSQQALQPWTQEMALLQDYANIMVARFEDRVQIHWAIDPQALTSLVPAMISQPLLENAFKHAVEQQEHQVVLDVCLECPEPGRIRLRIGQDRGHYSEAAQTQGQGLANIRARLQAHYGDAAQCHLEPRQPEGLWAILSLPCAY